MVDLEPLDKWYHKCIGIVGDALLPVRNSGTTAAFALGGEAFEKSGPVPVPGDILHLYQSMRYENTSSKQQKNRHTMPAEEFNARGAGKRSKAFACSNCIRPIYSYCNEITS